MEQDAGILERPEGKAREGAVSPSPSPDREVMLLTVVCPEDCARVCFQTQVTHERKYRLSCTLALSHASQGPALGKGQSAERSISRGVKAEHC